MERRRLSTAAFRRVNTILADDEQIDVLIVILSRLSRLLAIDYNELAALVERGNAAAGELAQLIEHAARRRGVDLKRLQRWLDAADRCSTLAALDRLKLPRVSKAYKR